MTKEYNLLMKNDTWDLVPCPEHKNISNCKWGYKTKTASNGVVKRPKAWIVEKGFLSM